MRSKELIKTDKITNETQSKNILMSDDDYEDALEDEDDDIDEDENDPIYQSDYNYDGNEDNIYFEDEDGEEALEDDEEEDDY